MAGNKEQGGTRIPMSVQDIIDLYKRATPKIFQKRKEKFFSMKKIYQQIDIRQVQEAANTIGPLYTRGT